MRFRGIARTALGLTIGMSGLVGAAPAAAPTLVALAKIEPGQWQLKEVGVSAGRSICMSDIAAILQLGHPGAVCQRFIITNEADTAVVHYTCPGAGHGRTTITVSTPRAFHLATQGIADGAPFDFDYEAHRTGACAPGATAAR